MSEREGRVRGCRRGGGERPPLFKLYQNSTAAVVSPVRHKDVPPPLQSRAPEGSQARIAGVLHH